MSFKSIPRCVVTGLDKNKSTIVSDGLPNEAKEYLPGLIMSDIWKTTTSPANYDIPDSLKNELIPVTPKNGTILRYIVNPPDTAIGAHSETGEHPLMHSTPTVDYVIILSGEIYLITEEKETLLTQGDIVIQRGIRHAWSNRSNESCIVLAILIGAMAAPRDFDG